MSLRNTYLLLRDLNNKANARQDDVRLLLKEYAGIVPEKGVEISFADLQKALSRSPQFGQSLYKLLYGNTVNAEGEGAHWTTWVQGITGGLSTAFGVIGNSIQNNKAQSTPNDEVLAEVQKAEQQQNNQAEEKNNTVWIIGGAALGLLVIAIVVVVIVKKKKK